MQTPEYWSEKIYFECYSPVMGHASVRPDFVAQIQADARAELIAALQKARPHIDPDLGWADEIEQAIDDALANNAMSHERSELAP